MKLQCAICDTIVLDDIIEYCGTYYTITGKCWRCNSESFRKIE